MKKITLLILSYLLVITARAQWTRTNVSTTGNANIESLCEHDGSLYASVFGTGLLKFDVTLNQWQTVSTSLPPSTNAAHITNLASSGNYLYAYVSNQTCATTTIYKSTDNGANFIVDTVGHPRYGSFPAQCAGELFAVAKVYVLNGKLINVINGGFYSKYPTDVAWVKTINPLVTFAELFGEYNNTWYAFSDNYKLHTSTDNGQTWVTPTNAGLPNMFLGQVLNVNPASGRIYVSGRPVTSTVQKLFYSDNEGATWDSLPINQILNVDWIGQPQRVLGMISNGDDITAMLSNNANNSHPDVIRSTDGGQTFSIDTVGLQPNSFGTVLPTKFLYYNGMLWLAPNYFDIYTQGTGNVGVKEISNMNATVYPNPVNNNLTIENDREIESISISNMQGLTIAKDTPYTKSHTIDMSSLPSGLYFVIIKSNNQTLTTKVIKE